MKTIILPLEEYEHMKEEITSLKEQINITSESSDNIVALFNNKYDITSNGVRKIYSAKTYKDIKGDIVKNIELENRRDFDDLNREIKMLIAQNEELENKLNKKWWKLW